MRPVLDEKQISLIVEEVLRRLREKEPAAAPPDEAPGADIDTPECKSVPLLQNPADPEALARMKRATTARIGVGRCGPRENTQTVLTLRADHAKARDAVFTSVDEKVLESLGLFTVQTCCADKNTYVTRPDLGRKLSEEACQTILSRCEKRPDVQIFAADGLSSTAVEASLPKILPVLLDSLQALGLKTGTPFFVRFGRVGVEDHVAEVLGAKVVCVLLGERPGLATAESMVEVSARHVHLTREAMDILFGAGSELHQKRALSQPGEFLSDERVKLVTGKGEIASVAVLGPLRKAVQVELSMTDCRQLGVAAPVNLSGDLTGAGDVMLLGPAGYLMWRAARRRFASASTAWNRPIKRRRRSR